MNKAARYARRAAIGLWLAVALGSLVGFANNSGWLLYLCAQPRILYVAFFVLSAAIFGMIRRWKWLAASALMAAVNFAVLVPYWTPPELAHATGTKTVSLRVMQMNTWVLNQHFDKIVGLIEQTQPDVIAFEELWPVSIMRLEQLGLSAKYPHRVTVPNHGKNSQVGLWSRLEVRNLHADYENHRDPIVVGDVALPGTTVQIMALHPHVPGRLDYYRKHKRHLDRLLTLRNQAPNLVIMGDLNTCPYTARMAKIIGALEAYDTRTGLGPLPTWSRWIPFLPIDYVICSKNIRVRQLQTTPAAGSDHLTIIADLEVPI